MNRRGATIVLALVLAVRAGAAERGLTLVPGVKVGHHTLTERPTGCTVVLVEEGAVAGVDVRGGAPGTRETDLLDPINLVQHIDAVVLAGGSAFGLEAATGVVRYLEEHDRGYPTSAGKVPIVPAAILIDLAVGANPKVRPTADCGYRAASVASRGEVAEGNVGAGAGATVGKLLGMNRAMKGGVGTASTVLPNGVIVAALAVVNALGDVIQPETGEVVAGARTEDGKQLADARVWLRRHALGARRGKPENTTLGVVATNARLDKAQATKMAQMAQDGLARAIAPAHTPYDGDTIFTVATGAFDGEADLAQLGAIAADMMAEAIVRGVRTAASIPGFPAAKDIKR
ncbi:MAG: P1 family peptidase [Acidobacteria bacterium]|nr:P1 family peptidase [Acidobacteriota bacterium]